MESGKDLEEDSVGSKPAPNLNQSNNLITPYNGPWTAVEASHLLRRCTFGGTKAQINQVITMGLEASIEQLFQEDTLPEPPLNYDNLEDPNVAIGETWIDEQYTAGVFLWGYRSRSIRAWTMETILKEGISIREKLTLFWQNHFAVSQIVDANFLYLYITKLRTQAWGNFRELVKAITIDPSMLIFLDGHSNTNGAPNENYARELLELFTLGKGPLAGPGDYTTFTEQDVLEIARVLTGWKDQGFLSEDIPVAPFFYEFHHDTGEKQLSDRLGGHIIPNMGATEYLNLIDLIFEQDETAYFISRKLYRWFVSKDIDEEIEQTIIDPMAQLILENDFELEPALKSLLGSQHFFDQRNRGQFIKSPLVLILSLLKKFERALPEDIFQRYSITLKLYSLSQQLDMDYYNPPEVSGWDPFRQTPLFHRVWINANSLRYREEYSSIITQNGYLINNLPFHVDVLQLINNLENPFDPNSLIEEVEALFLSHPLTHYQRLALKDILIPGLPDFEWTVEYSNYLGDLEDLALRNAIEQKLRIFFRNFFRLPEFYLT